MSDKNVKGEKKTLGDKITNFILKFRIPLLVIVGVLVVGSIAAGVYFGVTESAHKKGLAEIDSIMYPVTQKTEGELVVAQDMALSKLDALAEKNKNNIVGIRAYMAIAEINFSRENWEAAANAWVNAANADSKAYTAAVSSYNAGVCYEELGDFDSAIAQYEKTIANKECLFVPHALFSLGRIAEEKGDYETAKAKYEELVNKYASNEWSNLAESRLIALEIADKAL